MPSGRQIRAARALLGISAKELAERAKVGWATVQRMEQVDGSPTSRVATLRQIEAALEKAGIEFIGDPETTPGVRLKAKRGD